jgi:3-hydroxyacyl-CoA dehydrogenase
VREAQRLLSEGVASEADIDRVLTGAAGFRIGHFALPIWSASTSSTR